MLTLINLPLINLYIEIREQFLKMVNWIAYFRDSYNLTVEIRRLLNYN